MRHMTLMLIFSLPLLSCLQPQYPDKPETAKAKEEVPALLPFAVIAIKAEDKKRLAMTAQSLLYADETVPLIHLTQDGVSSSFQVNENVFGPESFLEESGKFQLSYNLLNRGWLGLARDSVKSLNLVNSKLSSYALSSIPDRGRVIGVGYDFVAFYQGADLLILEVTADRASLVTPARPPVEMKSIQKCIRGCKYWGFDGGGIFTLNSTNEGWIVQSVNLSIPEGKSLIRLAGQVGTDAQGKAQVTELYGLDQNIELYKADLETDAARLPTWDNVSAIVQQYCIGCHSSDGFDQEAVFAALKTEVQRRVDPKRIQEPGAMPPPDSVYGKSFVAGDAELIMAWLATKDDPTKPGKPDDPTKPGQPSPDKPIAGELKKLADQYCVSCHSDNQKEVWWISRKQDVKERVESGDMPRNRPMPDADRKKLIELVQGLASPQ